ncbi:transketolase [Proteiniclasticum ruminis]|uniref:Transketolase n=1 Tax=Proteiniclasticum ruminis TaxID=398199 RepID=A0A1G8JU61_9CLOT|nr:transketolase [Proteiniclasticum ruminis]SDI34744.1 transketolase [Proteiniclasticum ruminis]
MENIVENTQITDLSIKAAQLRRDVLTMIQKANSGHPGGSLSMMEMIVTLYYYKMRLNIKNSSDPKRDRFVLSKGHAAPALYAVLADLGYFDKGLLDTFRQFGSPLQGHPDKKKLVGLDASTGSLGQGVSIAVGMALGARLSGAGASVYCILGDGEHQEGQVWEAAMAAGHYKLNNLTLLVDNNKLQIDGKTEDIMDVGNLADKYRTFGFEVIELMDGHDLSDMISAVDMPSKNKPKCIIAHTIKGKGVSFMENEVGWHGRGLTLAELNDALKELY